MVELVLHLKDRCTRAGVDFDTYDLDFIVGCIFEWLGATDKVITADGIWNLGLTVLGTTEEVNDG